MDLVYFIKEGKKGGLFLNEPIVLAVIKNIIADFFEINCRHHSMFISGYTDASTIKDIDGMISLLEGNMPTYWRYKKRAEIQIRGFQYYNETQILSKAQRS